MSMILSAVRFALPFVTFAFLAGCGGGGDTKNYYQQPVAAPAAAASAPASAPASLPAKVGKVTMAQGKCSDEGKALTLGENGRCLFMMNFTTDANVSVGEVNVSRYANVTNVDDDSLSHVYAIAPDGTHLNQDADFSAGIMKLRLDLELKAGATVMVPVVGNVAYRDDYPVGAQVGFTASMTKIVSLDASVQNVSASGGFTTKLASLQKAAGLEVAELTGDRDYFPGAQIIGTEKIVNPSAVTKTVKRVGLSFNGNVQSLEATVRNCVQNIVLTVFDKQGAKVAVINTTPWGAVDTKIAVPGGEYLTVQVSADLANCWFGEQGLRISFQLWGYTTSPLKAPDEYFQGGETNLFLPVGRG